MIWNSEHTATSVIRVLYLRRDADGIANLYSVDPDHTTTASIPLSTSAIGVDSYDVSVDGTQLVYAEVVQNVSSRLLLLNISTRQAHTLLNCDTAICNNPVWRPGMGHIAFERTSLRKGRGIPVPRVWLLTITPTGKAGATESLFEDNQRLSQYPVWSPDGTHLAAYSASENSIVIQDMDMRIEQAIGAPQFVPFQFSPDGNHLSFPKMVALTDNSIARHAIVLDSTAPDLAQRDISSQTGGGEYEQLLWESDDSVILLQATRTADKTRLFSLWRISLDSAVEPSLLLTTGDFIPYNLTLQNNKLLFERYTNTAGSIAEGLWMYDLTDRRLVQIDPRGFNGRWAVIQK